VLVNKARLADFLLIHPYSGWLGRRAAEGIKNKANSASLAGIGAELGKTHKHNIIN
jgi:hypothetical protein